MTAFLLLSFLLGLVVGSFLNVVILRGAAGESLGGRSRCTSCGKVLSVRELIPVVSFVIQKARCRSCGAGLSWQYPLVELATACGYLFAAWLLLPGLGADLTSVFVLVSAYVGIAAVIVIVVADFRFQVIPDGAVVALLAMGVLAGIARHALVRDAAAALVLALFFAALWLVSRGRWMGFGDAKLTLATSLIVGFPASLAAFLFSFWLGGIAAVPLLLFKKRAMQSRIPFGPFIIAGTILAYFFSASFFRLAGFWWLS